ncbi:MAG TPA: YggT family protein [Chthonomonadaceae bacterium]|nr:YggT family protein [Chthonomonadaceae bacterium]
MSLIVQLLVWVIYALITLTVIEVVFSYMFAFRSGLSPYHPAVRIVRSIVNPMLDPIRRLLPPSRTGNLDFSPMILIMVLSLIRSLLIRAF